MGQYFKAINLDKKEYVCPWCLGGGAKLWRSEERLRGLVSASMALLKCSIGCMIGIWELGG